MLLSRLSLGKIKKRRDVNGFGNKFKCAGFEPEDIDGHISTHFPANSSLVGSHSQLKPDKDTLELTPLEQIAPERREPPDKGLEYKEGSAGSNYFPLLHSDHNYTMDVLYDSAEDGIDRVKIEFFTNEKGVKERLRLYFIKNQRSSLKLRIVYFILKLISCIVYLITIANDEPTKATCYGCGQFEPVAVNLTLDSGATRVVYTNRMSLLWVNRAIGSYVVQVLIAFVCFGETLLLMFLEYKGNMFQQVITVKFMIECITSLPFIVSIGHPMMINLYVPTYFNCWLAKMYLERMLNDFQLVMMRTQSNLSRQVVILLSSISCIFITCMFGINYLERANTKHDEFSLSNSLWFVVVTFSTVGYGDLTPSWVPSRLFVAATICGALMVIPIQLEKMAFYWRERQKQGGTYSSHRAETEKHVILCATYLSSDVLMDFLNEFYAHPALQTYFVVLLSPSELDSTIKMILQVPLWSQRVIYIQGSALKDQDLVRAKADMAQCCFILASRNEADRNKADQATILRTWAVKDFSPMCPLFVQILRPENKFHISFADHIVCEEELKYALLANNCVLPAVSTLTTLLLHTLKGREKSNSREEWERNYSHSSGQEIYHKKLKGSLFFGEYVDANFSFAAFHSHKKYGITLIGVQPRGQDAMLNPGPSHIMSESDICYYINTTKEEQSSLVAPKKKNGGKMTEKQIRRELIEAALNTNQIPRSASRSRVPPAMYSPGKNPGTPVVGANQLHDPEEHTTDPHNHTGSSRSPDHHSMAFSRSKSDALKSVPSSNSLSLLFPGNAGSPGASGDGGTNDGGTSGLGLPMSAAMSRRRASIMPVSDECMSNNIIPDTDDGEEIPAEEWEEKYAVSCGIHPSKYMKGYPAILPYTGFWSPQVYLIPDLNSVQSCCLKITHPCHHKPSHLRTAMDYQFPSKSVIIAAEYPTLALFNFIVPLRSHCRPRYALNPVILLLEKEPDAQFMEAMTCYPMVFYALGNIERLDDVLRAGICRAEAAVIIGKESSKTAKEEYMADSQTIVAVQTLCKLFPAVSIITELTHPSNMRFMRFHASEVFESLHLTNKEKKSAVMKAKREGSTLTSYLYRKPFAAGHVFSASMLDTLLYQAFVKPYIIGITNLFLGLQQNDKSGHLFSMRITEKELWIRTYGRLFQRLCSTTYEIPIGIYRFCDQDQDPMDVRNVPGVEITVENDSDSDFSRDDLGMGGHCSAAEMSTTTYLNYVDLEKERLDETVRQRMEQLGMKPKELSDISREDKRSRHSYVIINPDYDFPLKVDDIIYLIRPPKPNATPIPQRRRMPPKPVNFRRASIRRCSVNVSNAPSKTNLAHNNSGTGLSNHWKKSSLPVGSSTAPGSLAASMGSPSVNHVSKDIPKTVMEGDTHSLSSIDTPQVPTIVVRSASPTNFHLEDSDA